jgi:hypothetical protein
MTDHYEMPHPDADACAHAGVGKACRPCREVLDNLHRISLRDTGDGRELMVEGWKEATVWVRYRDGTWPQDMEDANPYREETRDDHA